MLKFDKHGKNGFNQELIDKLTSEEKELSFLCGYVSLNPVFKKEIKEEMPQYTRIRFEVVTKANNYENRLAIIPTEELESLKNGEHFKTSYFKDNAAKIKERLKIKGDYICNTLRYCSPWLSNDEKTFKNRGKVYTSVYVMFENNKKVLLTQQFDQTLGYIAYPLCATATVLFPPTKKDETWTVGWIKAITKSDINVEYGETAKFIFIFIIAKTIQQVATISIYKFKIFLHIFNFAKIIC